MFENGVVGVAAKRKIEAYTAFLFIPNSCIISLDRAKACDELRPVYQSHSIFSNNHPDQEQIILTTFLLYHKLQGKKSFWHPFIEIMNPGDLPWLWPSKEVNQFMDVELKMESMQYGKEIEQEWKDLEPVFKTYSDLFPGFSKDIFLEVYNNVCTRCFGWTLPNTMLVPLADCQNHLPVDTHYDVYSKDLHISK